MNDEQITAALITDTIVNAACKAFDPIGWGLASGETTSDMRFWHQDAPSQQVCAGGS